MKKNINQRRKKVHAKVVWRTSEWVATISAFLLIFTVLMTISNWPAYSRIIQDWIDPDAITRDIPASLLPLKDPVDHSLVEVDPQFDIDDTPEAKEQFSIADLGDLYPDEMRLEIPKIFEGSIPVKGVDIQDFNFKDLYTSENKIQEALREGVVHYPYTANPDQYGNVFITGHSSYYPWDEGRYKDIFALLHKLDIGDQYFITYKGKRYLYEVREMYEVQPDDISVLEQPEDQKISTLMTCTPVGTVLRRLIVKAELVAVD